MVMLVLVLIIFCMPVVIYIFTLPYSFLVSLFAVKCLSRRSVTLLFQYPTASVISLILTATEGLYYLIFDNFDLI